MQMWLLFLSCLPCVLSDYHVVKPSARLQASGTYTQSIHLGEPMQQLANIYSAQECQNRCMIAAGCTSAMLMGDTCNLYSASCQQLSKPDSCTDEEWSQQRHKSGSSRYVIHHEADQMTFEEGFRYCLSNKGHMLAIETQCEQDIIGIILRAHYPNCVTTWTGGQLSKAAVKSCDEDLQHKYVWNMTDHVIPMDVTYWANREPNNGNNQQYAITMLDFKDYRWNDAPRDDTTIDCVVCEFEI